MMTYEEIIAHDLRHTAIHEAGHLVVLIELGGSGYIRLAEKDDSDLINNSAYSGKTYIMDPLKADDDMRIMALAGEIAVLLDKDPDAQPDEVIEHFEMEFDNISETDKAHGITYEAAEQALEILNRRWGDVLHHAENEISKEATQ